MGQAQGKTQRKISVTSAPESHPELQARAVAPWASTQVDAIIQPTGQVIVVHNSDSVSQVLSTLRQQHVKSAAVCAVETPPTEGEAASKGVRSYVGAVDCALLAHYLARSHDDSAWEKPLGTAVKLRAWDFMTVNSDETVEAVLHQMMFNRTHRLQVLKAGELVAVITQKRVIQLIHEHLDKLTAQTDHTLAQLGLVSGNVRTCRETTTLRDAYLSLNTFQALAVIDAEGKLVGQLTTDSIRDVADTATLDSKLCDKRSFVYSVSTCGKDATLRAVLAQLANQSLYRVFVVDDVGRPLSVITLSTCLEQVARF